MSDLSFETLFGRAPQVRATAPGRVNMMGDHTDYNDGFVLPIAIAQETRVEIAIGEAYPHEAYSVTTSEKALFERTSMRGFARYVGGCVYALEDRGYQAPPLRLRIDSDVPAGIGLSSSAALEVATLRALTTLLKIDIDAVQLALIAREAEASYAGVNCGIMDQMASSLASRDRMLFLDTRTLTTRLIPIPDDCEIIVADSGLKRQLHESAYNTRRRECDEAAGLLGVTKLRDVKDPKAAERLPSPWRERARHVISENNRVIAALGASAAEFGALMNESHRSLRDDFQVSAPALDVLVAALQAQPAVYGARMTGAGFGGACVALARPGVSALVREALQHAAPQAQIITPSLL